MRLCLRGDAAIILFTLFKNDLKLYFKDWKAFALLMAAPFAFISFFAYALSPYLEKSSFVEPFSVALVDNENTTQTRILGRQLDEIGIFKEIIRTSEPEAGELLSENRVASVVIIPPGFSESVAVGENKPVTVIGNTSMPLESFVVKNLMQSAANLVSAGQSAINSIYHYSRNAGMEGDELEKVFSESTMEISLEALARNEIFSQVELLPEFDLTPMEYFTAALIVVFLMFAGMPSAKMLVVERNYGLTGRLDAAGVGVWRMVLSKLMLSLVLSILQLLMVIVLTAAVFRNYWGASVKSVLVLFGAIMFAVSSWSILVSAVSRTPSSADVIGNLGILLMAIIGGNIYPLSTMPQFVRDLSRLTISRRAMEGFMVLFSGGSTAGVADHALALLIIGAVLLTVSVGIMRVCGSRK
jgi:ABC-2 type transport system permease protein